MIAMMRWVVSVIEMKLLLSLLLLLALLCS